MVGHPNQCIRAKERLTEYLKLLQTKSENLLNPGQHLSIDEALILWKGRLYFRQFIKSKRTRFGVKIFFCAPADPAYQGYSFRFTVYYGKNSDL